MNTDNTGRCQHWNNAPAKTEFTYHQIICCRLVVHITGTVKQHTQDHKKWLAAAHYRIGVFTRPTLTWASEAGNRGVGPPGIWNLQQEKIVFLVSSRKNQISPLLAPSLEKYLEKSTSGLLWKKSFRRPWTLTGAKHFKSTPTVASFTHHNARIQSGVQPGNLIPRKFQNIA